MDLDEKEQEELQIQPEEKQVTENIKDSSKQKKLGQIALVILVVIVSMVGGFFMKGMIDAKKTPDTVISDPVKIDPNQKPPDIPNIPPDPNIQKDPATTGKILFKISSESITDTDLASEIGKLKPPDFDQRIQQLPEKDQQVYRDQIKNDALKNLVNQIYFRLYLKDQKITITQADQDKTKADLIDIMKKIHEQQNTGTPFSLEERLKQYNISMDTFLNDIKNQTIYRVATSPIMDKIKATEEEAKAFFKNHPEMYNELAQADLKHILLTTESEADAVIKELNQGADFTSVAKAKSKDPQVQENGGALGFISNDKSRVPIEILNVIFNPSTKLNTPVKIQVETQWYVMTVLSIKPEVIKTYTELSDKAMFDVKEEKRTKALDEFIKTLEAKYGEPVPQK